MKHENLIKEYEDSNGKTAGKHFKNGVNAVLNQIKNQIEMTPPEYFNHINGKYSLSTIYNYCRSGKLDCVKRGKGYIILINKTSI